MLTPAVLLSPKEDTAIAHPLPNMLHILPLSV